MLHSRIRPLPHPRNAPLPSSSVPRPDFTDDDETNPDESPEDLFEAFLPQLFPDDTPSLHGNPGQHLLYSSPRYGELEIMVPSYPDQSQNHSQEKTAGLPRSNEPGVNQVDEGRKLFAHFLWSAAIVVAERVEAAESLPERLDSPSGPSSDGPGAEIWKVAGESVLELGAGAALPSIICALANASAITITDHPASPALSGAIAFNIAHNLPATKTKTPVTIRPHEWGNLETDPWAVQHKGAFTRIIAADCYWMRSQHENLVHTMRWFLAPRGKVWVVAGFHTARAIVAGFFETAVRMGMVIEEIYERDLVAEPKDGREVRREWVEQREGEGPENRRRWCVVALLGKREGWPKGK